MSKFYIHTFGCRCNQADSASMRAGLSHGSLEEARSLRDADLVVINTCTVTHRTDQQVRQTVRRFHRENPSARLVLTGCYAQRDPRALSVIPGVNLVVGNADRDRLVSVLEATAPHVAGTVIRTPLDSAGDCLPAPVSQTGSRTRPFVKLQDGCDARCSYCIVPKVRGPGRSARPEDILSEVRGLVARGFQEIVLTGVHLGTYGRRLETPVSIVELLKRILDIRELGRLRLSSIEPMRFSGGLVRLAVENPVLAPHFHIPMQSGSDRILRLMRRPYTAARFLDLLDYIRSNLPAAGLGTDVLVGFPGETESDFERTAEIIGKSPLTYMHVFPFSAREGTDAFTLPDQVEPRVIRERARILREVSLQKNLAFRRTFLQRTLPALSLAKDEGMGESVVLTENYIHARTPPCRLPPNRLVNVRIVDVQSESTLAVPEPN
jgi:threonylcarbamoyladenosine tRNA methylthiotransferase MtaB